VHGAYGTGGPLVVFVTGRDLDDRRAFRATLAVLWLILNGALVVGFALRGALTGPVLGRSLLLVPVALAALALGNLLAARLRERLFRALTAALLGGAGFLLLLRGA
jgi:uncharacterized membrane protein YfcA